jgi:hypothetical protein
MCPGSVQFMTMRLYIALILSMPVLSMSGLGQAKGPLLQIEDISRDVGTVLQGETIKQIFAFTNKGPGTLEIFNVEHS